MTYLFNLLLVPIYYLLIHGTIRDKQKANKYFAFIVCTHAVLFRALANPYNYSDTEFYALAYQDLADASWIEFLLYTKEWGVGYIFLNWILGHINSDPQFLFASLSVISIVPVIWFYYKTSNNLLLSMMIYLTYPMMYYMGFGVVRQHAAVAYVLLSLYYIGEYNKSIPLALLACSLHTSAILALPFFFWRKFNIKKIGIVGYSVFVIIGLFAISFIAPLVIKYFEVSRYDDALVEEGTRNNVVPVVLMGSLLVMSAINGLKKKLEPRKFEILSFLMYGLIIAIFSMGMDQLGRATIYFFYVIPVTVTWLSKYNPKNKLINTLYIFMVFVLIGILLYRGYEPGRYDYSFYWD